MYYDLNVRLSGASNNETTLNELIKELQARGFKGIAINTEIDESVLVKQKKQKEKSKISKDDAKDLIPLPYDVSKLRELFPKLYFYTRININVSDAANIQKVFQSSNFKKYDLVAFQPETQTVLKVLSNMSDVDIISYNPETQNSLSFSRKLYNQCIQHNIYFELIYAPAIVDSTCRRNLISLSHLYHAVGKSKNIIVSSGGQSSAHIRGPYDIMNLCLLFGLSEEQCKSVVSKNCEKLLLKARKQRRGKSTIEMIKKDNIQLQDKIRI